VRLNAFVNSAPGFDQQAAVANGASDLLVEIFGEAGRHTRVAVGASDLPGGFAVEVDLIAALG
jgi:enamine deaminase RidA (YjgF/YER057c/UK114 family)